MLPLSNLSPHAKGLMYACITSLCWGFLAILLKNALSFTDSGTIVAFRMIFALMLLTALNLIQNPSSFKILKKPPVLLLLGSLGLAYNYFGYMNGIALSGASNAQIMIQTGPVILMLTGFLFYKDGINKKQIFWILFALAGFFIFFKDQAQFIDPVNLFGANLWIVSAAVSWVVYSITIKHFSGKGYSISELNLVVFLICSIVLSYNLSLDELSKFTLNQWLFLMVLGANTLIAYGCFGAALKLAPASQVSIIITVNPILTLAIIAFAGEQFSFIPHEPTSLIGYMGAALVVTGITASTLSAAKKTG